MSLKTYDKFIADHIGKAVDYDGVAGDDDGSVGVILGFFAVY